VAIGVWRSNGWRVALAWAGFGAIVLWWLLRSWQGLHHIEFGDESMRYAVALQLRDGGRLYLDAIDHHGPGTYFIAQLASLLGASRIEQFRLVMVLLSALAAVALAFSPAWQRPSQRLIAAGTYLLVTASLQMNWAGQMLLYQTLAGHLAVIALALVVAPLAVRRVPPRWALMSAGACWAMAMFGSASFVFACVPFTLALAVLMQWRVGWADAVRGVLAFVLGGLGLGLPLALWVVAWSDWTALFAYHVYLNSEVYSRYVGISWTGAFHLPLLAKGMLREAQAMTAAIMLAFGLAGCLLMMRSALARRGEQRGLLRVLLAGALLLLCALYLDPRGGGHWHSAGVYFFSAGLLACGLACAAQAPAGGRRFASVLALLAMFATAHGHLAGRSIGGQQVDVISLLRSPSLSEMANWPQVIALRAAADPEEPILAYPFYPVIYLLAERQAASAHLALLPWMMDYVRQPFEGVVRDPCAEIAASRPPAALLWQGLVWNKYRLAEYAPCITTYAREHFVRMEPGEPALHVRPDRVDRVLALGLGFWPQDGSQAPVYLPSRPLGELLPGVVHRYAIVVGEGQSVDRFDLQFATYARTSPGLLSVQWRAASGELLLDEQVRSETLRDNAYRRFDLERPAAAGSHLLQLEALEAEPGQAVTVWVAGSAGEETPASDAAFCLRLFDGDRLLRGTPGCTE